MAKLEFSAALGRVIRKGEPASELGRSSLLSAYELIDRGQLQEAKEMLEYFRQEQEIIQNVMVEWVWAMLTWVQQNVGEEQVEVVLRDTLSAWVGDRYGDYLELTFDEQVALAVEGMRGHLSGPGRVGNVEVEDLGDRVVISFDPCGSGGWLRRGEAERGVPPASERPELGHSDQAHSWTWRRESLSLLFPLCVGERNTTDRRTWVSDPDY